MTDGSPSLADTAADPGPPISHQGNGDYIDDIPEARAIERRPDQASFFKPSSKRPIERLNIGKN
jgi:hypothetical protein